MFDFEKLDVYHKAKKFNRNIRTDILKKDKIDRISHNQLNRAAMSIMLNIAESSGRFTKPDKRNFFVIARGSVFECVAIFDFLLDEQIITKAQYKEFYDLAEELSKMLFGLIKSLE